MKKSEFPRELADLPQWICWRLERDDKGGKDRKVPYNAATGKKASSTDPKTWTTLDAALDAKQRYMFSGVGFVFTKDCGIVGVDIDHCIGEDGALTEIAAAIVSRAPATYTEISPSGTGLHLFLRGTLPAGGNRNAKSAVEMYADARYFTVTGNVYNSAPPTVAADDGALAWLHQTYIAAPKKSKKRKKQQKSVPLSDEELIAKARESGDGESFAKLWDGDWEGDFGSQSEADLSLCNRLAFWSGRNREQMDRLFRQAKLFRPKWDERHHADGATYGEETLTKAIDATENVYSPDGSDPVFAFNGCYFRSKGDKIYPITNFLITPVEMIESEDETQITVDLVTASATYRTVFMTTDFANLQRFKNVLNRRTIALSYFGNEADLEIFKGFIAEMDWVRKRGIKAIGVVEFGGRLVYVGGDNAVVAGGAPEPGIVQLEKYRGITSDILKCKMLTAEQLRQLGAWLTGFNEPRKTVAVLSWIAGCFVKPHLRLAGIKFPHLFLIGEAGSGKSNTLERVILPVFSRVKVTAATQVTAFTLMRESASSNLVPQPLDEFKPSKMERYKQSVLYNHFRDAYDAHEGVRGRADQTSISYELLAPLVVAGEESADEAAVRERSIELLFSKKDLQSADRKAAFMRLCANEPTLGAFGRSLLDVALGTAVAEVRAWHEDAAAMFSDALPARVISNLACAYCGLRLAEKLCAALGLTWHEVFPVSLADCRQYLEVGVREYLFDGGTTNISVVEQTFEILARMGLDPMSEYDLSADGKVLSICLYHVYDRYTKYRHDFAIAGEVLQYVQFRKQLAHSDILVAKNESMWLGGATRKVWKVNFTLLQSRCDVSGFEHAVTPLTS